MTEHPPHPSATRLPEMNDLEIDIAIARRVYGFQWHDVGVQCTGIRIYMLADPTTACADWTQRELPTFHMRGPLMFNPAGEQSATLYKDMPRPTQGFADAWNLARFVAREKKLQVGLSYHTPPEGVSTESTTITSWHRDEGLPDVSERTCIHMRMDTSLERGLPRSVLELYDLIEAGK